MVPWFPILSCVYKNVRMKRLTKFNIYIEFCLLCQVLLTLGVLNSLTHLHWELVEASPFPGVFLQFQDTL